MQKQHEFSYMIRFDDLDAYRHVGNAHWLTILERSRIDLVKQLGYSTAATDEEGVMMVVAEANIKYFSPAFYDDEIKVRIGIGEVDESSVWLKYKCKNQNGLICVIAKTKMVFVNKEGQPIGIPSALKKSFDVE